MGGHEAGTYWEHRGLVLLWLSVLSGPFAWALNQLIGYALVKPVCAAGSPFVLTAIAGGALAITVVGGWTAWTCMRALKHADPKGGSQEDRSQLLAISGVGLNLLLGLLIATSALQPFFLSPCE
jgi:hypothetical protein